MSVKLLTEHHLEFLSFKGGCIGLSESIHVKMPHCWKSHVVAHIITGRLRFVNIERGDVQGGKSYSCHAINYFMRKDMAGPEHFINVVGCKYLGLN